MTEFRKLEFGRALLGLRWEDFYRLPSCQQQYDYFENTVKQLMEVHFPRKEVTRCSSDRPWVTDSFKAMVRKRQRALKEKQLQLYRFYRNRVNRARKLLQRQYYSKKVNELSSIKPREWWKEVEQLLGLKKTDNGLQGLANSVADGNCHRLADMVSASFQSVTTDYRADDIPNWILKEFSECLSSPVCAPFNSSLRQGHVPQVWKSAIICPLAKVPSPSAVEKHLRPISLTPTLSKVLERYVSGWVMDTARGIIDDHQFGSLRGSSTIHALVELVHLWQKALDVPGRRVRVLLLDFSEAFDRVDHSLLLEKFGNLGLPDFLVRWLTSFLCQRGQKVKLCSAQSEWTTMNAGVPQGTVLGPVGFLLHINDLHTTCDSTKYVDDTTFWESRSADGSDSQLQVPADQAYEWSEKNLMKINPDKTKTMEITFTRTHYDIPPCVHV